MKIPVLVRRIFSKPKYIIFSNLDTGTRYFVDPNVCCILNDRLHSAAYHHGSRNNQATWRQEGFQLKTSGRHDGLLSRLLDWGQDGEDTEPVHLLHQKLSYGRRCLLPAENRGRYRRGLRRGRHPVPVRNT